MDYEITIVRMLLAIVAGGIIGLERTRHGRPAGLRTHALVCAASCLLMLFTVFQWDLLKAMPRDTIRVDPTRMAQGIMTGIGFLGAGVIMKEKFTVRGLTTAGSIWMTASIGIIIGIGLYFAAIFATLATITVLSMFRWIERVLPTQHYGKLMVKFKTPDTLEKDDVLKLLKTCGVNGYAPSFHLDDEGRYFKYVMTIRTNNFENFNGLSNELKKLDVVKEFTLIPTGD